MPSTSACTTISRSPRGASSTALNSAHPARLYHRIHESPGQGEAETELNALGSVQAKPTDLAVLFGRFGRVEAVNLKRRDLALVNMQAEHDAEAACVALHRTLMMGVPLLVSFEQPSSRLEVRPAAPSGQYAWCPTLSTLAPPVQCAFAARRSRLLPSCSRTA